MKIIKTRTAVKDIKILDKSANLSARIKNTAVRTKERAEETRDSHSDSPAEYAIQSVENQAQGAADRAAHLPTSPAKATGKSVMVSGGEMLSTDSTGKGTLTMFDMEAELDGWDSHVQQVTAAAMEEADRKNDGFPIVILGVAVVLLAAGAALIVLAARRTKRKTAAVPPYAAPVQPSEQTSRRFCSSCGSPLGENSKFCGKCGQRLQ